MQEGDQSRSLIHNTPLCVFILEFHTGTITQKNVLLDPGMGRK